MRIGVLGCFYGSADILPEVLSPWLALKKEGEHEIVLAGINVQFKEYAQMGFPNDDHATRSVLESFRGEFDLLEIAVQPMTEKEARTLLLEQLLARDVDVVWLLDGDELYTKDEICRCIDFVSRAPQFDYYHIHFNNYIFDSIATNDRFSPPRIFWAKRHGGLLHFEWDNELAYVDGTRPQQLVPGIVPKTIAHVRHLTWRRENVGRKIAYQEQHFGYCMYRYNTACGELEYNPAYFARFNDPMPGRIGEQSMAAVQPRLLVLYTAGSQAPHESLRLLIDALLVLDRANIVQLQLTLVGDPAFFADTKIQELLELCAWETNVMYKTGSDSAFREKLLEAVDASGAHIVYVASDTTLHRHDALFEMTQFYFKLMREEPAQSFGVCGDDHDVASERVVSRPFDHATRSWQIVPAVTGGLMLPREVFLTYARSGRGGRVPIAVWAPVHGLAHEHKSV